MFFSPFYLKKSQTGIIILHQKFYISYNYITITIFIIYCLYSYHNRWQLASENLIGTLCVVSGHFVFSFYIFLCLVNMFSIILCTMSNKILAYHTIPVTKIITYQLQLTQRCPNCLNCVYQNCWILSWLQVITNLVLNANMLLIYAYTQ